MGVCKCKKRTDLWCYKTVKPVCLDCIVDSEHQLTCVAPYVDWLNNPHEQDPICPLTQTKINDASNSIRFMNLQVFHLDAILNHCAQFPSNTAVAGFTIPGTEIPMLPQISDQTKLANNIREKLKKSPVMLRIIESQQLQVNQPNVQGEQQHVLSRKTIRPVSDGVKDEVILVDPTAGLVHNTSLRAGKRNRMTKRIRALLKSVRPKNFIIGVVVFIVVLYLFLYLFNKTLNLVEYEIFAWIPGDNSKDEAANLVDVLKQVPDLVQNSP
jgi:hypothetical protein